jgi:hypothetical protein
MRAYVDGLGAHGRQFPDQLRAQFSCKYSSARRIRSSRKSV